MADFTYGSNTVLDEGTGDLAIYTTGVFRDAGGNQVAIFDLNDSPIDRIQVGARGVHQSFKADIPDGLLDFGSTLMPVVSQESHRAGLQAIQLAKDAVKRAEKAEAAAAKSADKADKASSKADQAATLVVATPRFVLHGDDAEAARPDEDVLPVIWIGSVRPLDADPARDLWIATSPLVEG